MFPLHGFLVAYSLSPPRLREGRFLRVRAAGFQLSAGVSGGALSGTPDPLLRKPAGAFALLPKPVPFLCPKAGLRVEKARIESVPDTLNLHPTRLRGPGDSDGGAQMRSPDDYAVSLISLHIAPRKGCCPVETRSWRPGEGSLRLIARPLLPGWPQKIDAVVLGMRMVP